ncbi:DEAD/DEAH box helicase [Lichenicoccus sp.]|uniref:DEAD/DEAH box helicase n=1 Tax=Lichenicoccus sp. TaxID=2781899 RepID=UPI003D0FDCC7
MGYKHPTPIQAQAIPIVLMGRDVLGVAQTGTGKTAGFTLPLLDILSGSRARARMPRSLILEPTRELALQVAENFLLYGKYLKLSHALLIGGESMAEQKEALNRGVDVLIATPGRLLDLFERGGLLLTQTSTLVIDEADRMLDMGFIPDVERIVSLLSPNRQTLFFSATMAPEIRRLADVFLSNPKEITVKRTAATAPLIEEGLAIVAEADKRRALRRMLRTQEVQNALIFCNRKRDVDILQKSLVKHGFSAGALHGDLPQPVRFATLEKFKAGDLQLLVCSDVAARGIDIGGLSHVFNFDVPIHSEDYIHRIGRTGRAGRTGHAYSIASPYDRQFVDAIEKLIGRAIPHVLVEGIETLDWAEDDRRGRGRGRGGRPQSGARPEAAREHRRDHGGRAKTARVPAEIAIETASIAPAAITQAATGPAATTPAEAGPAEPQRRDRPRRERGGARAAAERAAAERAAAERAAAERAAPDRAPMRRDEPRREEIRDRGPRPEDQAAPVIGFGDEIPAFMLLPTRASRPDDGERDGRAGEDPDGLLADD